MAGGGGLRGRHPDGNARLMHGMPTAWRGGEQTILRVRHPVSLRGGESRWFHRHERGCFPRLRSAARLREHFGSNQEAAPALAVIRQPNKRGSDDGRSRAPVKVARPPCVRGRRCRWRGLPSGCGGQAGVFGVAVGPPGGNCSGEFRGAAGAAFMTLSLTDPFLVVNSYFLIPHESCVSTHAEETSDESSSPVMMREPSL